MFMKKHDFVIDNETELLLSCTQITDHRCQKTKKGRRRFPLSATALDPERFLRQLASGQCSICRAGSTRLSTRQPR